MAWSMPSPTPASSWSSSARKEGASDAVVRIRSRDRSRLASAAVRGLAPACAIALGWRTNPAGASGSGRGGRLTTGGWSTRPRQRPASSRVIRSRLRRSTPSGGGAAGCLLTGATHQGPVSSSRQPTQRLPWMIGAPQRWSVLSRSRRGSGDWELAALVMTGVTSAPRPPPPPEFAGRRGGREALAHGGGRRDGRLDQHAQDPLTAVTGHAVDAPCGLAQDLRDLHEHRVPPKVPVRVVVLLEVIDVGQQH